MAKMAAGFLKKDQKLIWVQKLEDPDTSRIYLQPFIESFNHTIAPAMVQETFGMLGAKTQYVAGMSENKYTLQVAIPAYSRKSAFKNWGISQKLKALVNPSMEALVTNTGKIYFQVFNLTGKMAGTLLAVQETVVVEQGWLEWEKKRYPKLIRLSLTFVEDQLLTSQLVAPPPATTQTQQGQPPAGSTDPTPAVDGQNSNPPTSVADMSKREQERGACNFSGARPNIAENIGGP